MGEIDDTALSKRGAVATRLLRAKHDKCPSTRSSDPGTSVTPVLAAAPDDRIPTNGGAAGRRERDAFRVTNADARASIVWFKPRWFQTRRRLRSLHS